MKPRYLKNVVTLELDADSCTGCGRCLEVCPHGVLVREGNTVVIEDRDACMECGACARNCPTAAIAVKTGVGCAAAVISSRLRGKGNVTCGGESGCCSIDSSERDESGKSRDGTGDEKPGCGCSS